MRWAFPLKVGFLIAGVAACFGILFAQRPFREYTPMEGRDSTAALPPDYRKPAEVVLGRLMYPSQGRGGGGSWLEGGGNWTVDYPKGDRFFAAALRRLTRLDVRSVEQPVNPDEGDDIYNWPYLHVGMPTNWQLTPQQAIKIREYLKRGGFMVADSFFGTQEWSGFERGLKQIYPETAVADLQDDDAIFHSVYDLEKRGRVGNYRSLRGRGVPYRADGDTPHWRAVRDDKGRIVFMIDFNLDLGDSWQLADIPDYPEEYSALGLRLGVNYVVYTMTH